MIKPRILILDIETAPNTCYTWGLWDQNIAHEQVEELSYILCCALKWVGQRGMKQFSIQNKTDKQDMLAAIHTHLCEADIVVHYNGTKFDIPTLNKEFIANNFPPPSPYKQIDLYKVVKSAFRFQSNKMGHVSEALGLGSKDKHEGFKLWVKCMKGDPAAWKRLLKYNRKDVTVTERLYLRIRPWIERHPNLGAYTVNTTRPACPSCGGARVTRQGRQLKQQRLWQQWQCQSVKCGRWFTWGLYKGQ